MHKGSLPVWGLICIVGAAYLLLAPTQPALAPALVDDSYHRVIKVTDGDTIVVDLDGVSQPVRLLGIDTPELETPYTKLECYGKEASDAAKLVMSGREVRLETDPSQDTYDVYHRLLAYVYVPANIRPEGIMVNEYMLSEGYAREYTYKVPYARQAEFLATEHSAKADKKGLWSSCAS